MRINSMRFILYVFGSVVLLVSQPTLAQDHLEPEVSIMYAAPTAYDYCQNLNALFFDKTPSEYLARMFCRPGFNHPQWCVTIYKDKDEGCTVEYTVAEKHINHAKDSLNIKVKKVNKPIDLETAQIVQEVFRRMLRGVRYADEEKDGGDGDEFSFSRNVSGMIRFNEDPSNPPAGSEQGLIYDPDEDSLTEKLVNIGEALKRFATAESEDKQKTIRDEIRRQARELETKLRSAVEPKGSSSTKG